MRRRAIPVAALLFLAGALAVAAFVLLIVHRAGKESEIARRAGIAPVSDADFHRLLEAQGTGAGATAVFHTPGSEWELVYQYDCSNFGMAGNFQVEIMNADGTTSGIAGVNALGTHDKETERLHSGGSFYLTIYSECQWHVSVYG